MHHQQTHISDFLVFSFVFGSVFGSFVRVGGSDGDEGGEDEELHNGRENGIIIQLLLMGAVPDD